MSNNNSNRRQSEIKEPRLQKFAKQEKKFKRIANQYLKNEIQPKRKTCSTQKNILMAEVKMFYQSLDKFVNKVYDVYIKLKE